MVHQTKAPGDRPGALPFRATAKALRSDLSAQVDRSAERNTII